MQVACDVCQVLLGGTLVLDIFQRDATQASQCMLLPTSTFLELTIKFGHRDTSSADVKFR
jgi:hypothetical protein